MAPLRFRMGRQQLPPPQNVPQLLMALLLLQEKALRGPRDSFKQAAPPRHPRSAPAALLQQQVVKTRGVAPRVILLRS